MIHIDVSFYLLYLALFVLYFLFALLFFPSYCVSFFFVCPRTFCYVFPLMLVVASEYHGFDFLLHNLVIKSWDIA